MWFFKRNRHPVAEAYLEGKREAKPAAKRPLEELRIVVIDAETTGLDVSRDRILSLAAAEVGRGGLRVNSLRNWIVYQASAGVNSAVAVHGITPAQTAAGEPEEKVMKEFLEMLRGAVVVGHHIGFDATMIDQALRKHFGVGLHNKLVDTAALAMRELEAFRRTGYANQRPPGLEEVCSLCGIPMMERHTAEGDVFTTAELFMFLCARRRRRLGRPLTFADLPVLW